MRSSSGRSSSARSTTSSSRTPSSSYSFAATTADEANTLVNLTAGIFILPFFVFSATAGQIADTLEKSRLVRAVKLFEIAIMAVATAGFALHSVPVLLASLFLMGVHSTVFGPIKYSILPQTLRDTELVGGNGLVEMGTFLAILLGTIVGGVAIAVPGRGRGPMVASAVLLVTTTFAGAHVLVDLLLIGLFGGFFIVPLYALIQKRSEPTHRSRIVAGNNILNALFMVIAAGLGVVLRKGGLTIPQLFLVTAILNAVVAIYIYTLLPEFLMRLLVWLLVHTIYRLKETGLEKIPEEGAVVLVCNHVSFVDSLLLGAACSRPTRFVMDHRIFKIPVLNFVFRTGRPIPIAPAKEDPAMMERAFDEIASALEAGDVVCIFPEGKLTGTGDMNVFRPGIERIIQRSPVPVIPIALQGLWGSFFSRKGGPAMHKPFRRFWSHVGVVIGDAVPAAQVTASDLEARVLALRGDAR